MHARSKLEFETTNQIADSLSLPRYGMRVDTMVTRANLQSD